MDPILGGALIGGGASLVGGIVNAITSGDAAAKNQAAQIEAAKHGITWRINDAMRNKDRINPLVSLGVTPTNVAPSYVGTGDLGITQAGQDISRAVMSGQDAITKEQTRLLKLQGDAQQIANTASLLALSGKRPSNDQTGTPFPVDIQPDKPTAQVGAGYSAGEHPEVTWYRTPQGRLMPYPSKDLMDYMSEDVASDYMFKFRNQIQQPPFPYRMLRKDEHGNMERSSDYVWIPGLGYEYRPKPKQYWKGR